MYSYPFFSFPHFRRYAPYYPSQTVIPKQSIRSKTYPSSFYNSSANHNYSDLHREPNCEPSDKLREKQNRSFSANSVKEKSSPKKAPTGFSFLNNFLHQEDRNDEEELFNLFGIKLYQDDILLIGLIFFLYQEDVKDQYLFFALILLLLS